MHRSFGLLASFCTLGVACSDGASEKDAPSFVPSAQSASAGDAAPDTMPIGDDDDTDSRSDERSEAERDQSCGELRALVRDFRADHPDMERFSGGDQLTTGLVSSELGADLTPTYLPPQGTAVTSGPAAFSDWFHDRAGVNAPLSIALTLTSDGAGTWVYANEAFFPIDGAGFGNEGREHNFHFTTEIHTEFTYRGGEHFTFTGDDDVWVFINRQLVIDLGGVHVERSGTADLDALAESIGLRAGMRAQLDVFQAERHTTESHFRMETTIDCIVPVL